MLILILDVAHSIESWLQLYSSGLNFHGPTLPFFLISDVMIKVLVNSEEILMNINENEFMSGD